MARFSVPAPRAAGAWLTTADVARALQVTRHGVRYLVQAGELRPVATPTTGQWLFMRAEVLAAVEARARRRLRAAGERWRALRLVVGRSAEPRQLALPLWGPGRKGATRPHSEPPRGWRETEAGLISTVTATRGAARRMAQADLHEHHDRRRA